MSPSFDPASVLPTDLDLAALRGGSTILVLQGGEPIRLVYDFDSLATIEEQYRTLAAMGDAIREQPFTHLPNVLAAGLRHYGDPALADGKQLRLRLDLTRIEDYTTAFAAAFTSAFGDLVDRVTTEAGDDEADPQTAPSTVPSRGDGGSALPSSTSGSHPGTSGA